MEEIGVGIIGFGFMGKTHAYGYRTIPLYYPGLPFRIRLVGVCDSVKSVAVEAKESLGFEFATDDPAEIYRRSDIQVVDVCTPNLFHKDGVLQALRAGKHVYCDKPLAVSYAEAGEILESAASAGRVTQMALQYRFYPATLRAKELIEEGRIGKVMGFRACYLHSGSVDPTRPIGWKQDKKFGGGGVLFDLGSHVLDLMYHFLGEYASVFAATRIVYPRRPDRSGAMVEIEADDMAMMTVRMKDGAMGSIEVSKVATGANDELRFEIHGDKGSLRFNLMEPNWLDFYDNTLPEAALGGFRGYTRIECVQRYAAPGNAFPGPKFSIGWIRGHVHCQYNFLNCVHEGKSASPSFMEGAYIQHVMEEAYRSDSERRWIDL
jgi:predicted dehydrogenase